METTLNQIKQILNLSSVIRTKHELLAWKKKGHIYISENLSALEEDEPFQLYWYLMANNSSLRNAFPIPRKQYLCGTVSEETWQEMMTYFSDYFLSCSKEEAKWVDFAWDYPYIGEEYVWITRKVPCLTTAER